MFGLFRMVRVIRTGFGMLIVTRCRVVLVELFRAIRTFEFMAFTGNGNQGKSRKQDGE
jgi:hypothetical protein